LNPQSTVVFFKKLPTDHRDERRDLGSLSITLQIQLKSATWQPVSCNGPRIRHFPRYRPIVKPDAWHRCSRDA